MPRFKLEEGEKLNRSPNKPILSIVGGAKTTRPYIWIGNYAEGDKVCFATLSGRANLERLANGILKALRKGEQG